MDVSKTDQNPRRELTEATAIPVPESPEIADHPLRERLKDLNTKAYYLLVALSFLYRTNYGSHSLKWAITLTALVAVLPLQDYVKSRSWLGRIRLFKVIALVAALIFTIFWVWTAATTPTFSQS